MAFEQKMVGEALVLTPRKNLVGGEETLSLVKAIDDVASLRPARVIIDLGDVNFVSSLGVGLLRRAAVACERLGGWLRLARTGKVVESTLNVTGLIIYFSYGIRHSKLGTQDLPTRGDRQATETPEGVKRE